MSETAGDVAARGLAEAIERLRQWISRGDYKSPTALSDATNNIYTLDNAWRNRLGESKYYTVRGADPLGQVVAGIGYARNFNVHESVLIEDRRGRRTFAVRGGTGLRSGHGLKGGDLTVTWRSLHDLPTPTRKTYRRDEYYADRVAGRDVVETLEEAAAFFDRLETI